MKLMRYERPGLAWPSFGRLTNFQDELDRLFESPLADWAPALDVHEDKDKFAIARNCPASSARTLTSRSRTARWSFPANAYPKD